MPAILPTTARGLLAAGFLALVATTAVAQPPPPWEFRDGDCIVFVGDTFVEREQRYGYVETVLTLANPDKNLTFRNLGWSGDTVRGLSRAGFDPPAAGFRELVKQVTDAKPTVLVVGYGMAESFDGQAGLPRFVEGYNALLDAVAPLKARLVLLSPLPHEAMAPPLPDPTAHNRDLAAYAEAVRSIAVSRDAAFVDLFDIVGKARARREDQPTQSEPDTDNGIHPTDLGFWRLASMPELGVKPGAYLPSKDLKTTEQGVQFTATDSRLPLPASPATGKSPDGARSIRVEKLKPGRYTLKVDGRNVVTKTAQEWSKGQALPTGPEAEQVEKLRAAIVAKNRLFFYRWRPQNITYLFGFRKHEQGRNAVEIPQFDPLVDAKEKEIAALRKPVQHTFELVRESEASR
ncbi:SGNH/GDSL hydrolase family protein [Paludisphaera rhizosphaerae]|uniref:SGNH/GDSL hydrolase family protein n=1 Tax=Paludisphaera rhizosphaerae TaxID=2711216 RepID=UPI0013EB67A4|nr:SGNH/GDSL hydrolase family protein [Paludisphaera rhizosphaerae]